MRGVAVGEVAQAWDLVDEAIQWQGALTSAGEPDQRARLLELHAPFRAVQQNVDGLAEGAFGLGLPRLLPREPRLVPPVREVGVDQLLLDRLVLVVGQRQHALGQRAATKPADEAPQPFGRRRIAEVGVREPHDQRLVGHALQLLRRQHGTAQREFDHARQQRAGGDLRVVVVDSLAEVVAALENAQQLADDVLAQHAVLLAVDEHLATAALDPKIVDDAPVVAQLEPGVERIPPQVVEQVGVDRIADDLPPERGHLATTPRQHGQHVFAQPLPVQFAAEFAIAEHRLEALGQVVARQQPGLIFDVVTVGNVRHVMQQGAGTQHPALLRGHLQATRRITRRILVARVEQAIADEQRADRVFEARMHGARIDERRAAELFDATQPLELSRIHQPQFFPRQLDVAVNRIAKDAQAQKLADRVDADTGSTGALVGVVRKKSGGRTWLPDPTPPPHNEATRGVRRTGRVRGARRQDTP